MNLISFVFYSFMGLSSELIDCARTITQQQNEVAVLSIYESLNEEAAENIDRVARNGNQGCCSHHSGVCGCSGGALQCCDGTLSPTCGCQ